MILRILGLEDFDLLLESGHLNASLCMRFKLLLELFNPVVAVALLSLEKLFHVGDHLVRFGLFSLYRVKLVLDMKLLAQDLGSVLLAGAKLLLKLVNLTLVLLLAVCTRLVLKLELIDEFVIVFLLLSELVNLGLKRFVQFGRILRLSLDLIPALR